MSKLPSPSAERQVQPCNFRSAGRLSNESARTLTTLHELLARNLVNSLDVYLGIGVEVKLAALDHLAIDDYRAASLSGGFILPCSLRPAAGTVLIEISDVLMFIIIDLLLGGTGTNPTETVGLSEIDEEIMQDVARLIAKQIERVWQPLGVSLAPGSSVKPAMAYRSFPPTEKILRIRFDVFVADVVGALYLALPASIGGQLVRSIKADSSIKKNNHGLPLPGLQERLLDSPFRLASELPDLRVPIRDLAAIQVGSLLKFSAPISSAGRMTLEDEPFYNVSLVQQDNHKAAQLLDALIPHRA